MKKTPAIFLIVAAICACLGFALAAGGTVEDPLISRSYLEGNYQAGLLAEADTRAASDMEAILQSGLGGLDDQKAELNQRIRLLTEGYEYHSVFSDVRLKRDDTVSGVTGTGVLVLAGSASVSFPSGTVVDVSAGEAVSAGSALQTDHRYLVAEDTEAIFTVTSDTAVLSTDGYFFLEQSTATDYNALADALKAMNLFRGSDTPYGSGYALEEKPTRIQGLVMFLRLIGEEDDALAFAGKNPFVDTDPWCDRYLAYAYAMGYTNGVDLPRGLFDPQATITATQYATFVLRALGYSDSAGEFSWDAALDKADSIGLITAGERTMLNEETFYRAQLVYLSYYSLSGQLKNSGTTGLDRLIAKGFISSETAQAAMSAVIVNRL
jgi:hypothetical protein